MNCEDYRKALTTEPAYEDESGHVRTCARCQAFSSEITALNERILAAMEIAAPELQLPALPEIDTENVVALSSLRSFSRPAWFAVAATVLLAVLLGVQMTGSDAVGASLAEQVVAHLDHEPGALVRSSTPVGDARLLQVVPSDIATMNHDVGLITYAENCTINGKQVPHLVIQGVRGPITILLMPEEKISGAETLDGQSIHGVILPVGDGSIAIIGERDEPLDRVQQDILSSVEWGV